MEHVYRALSPVPQPKSRCTAASGQTQTAPEPGIARGRGGVGYYAARGSVSRNVTACARCAELLAILLRTGLHGLNVVQMAQELLLDHGGWPGLQRLSFEELCHVHGFGEAKAAQVKAALEIGRRLLLAQPEQRPQITSPADVANLMLLEMSHLEQEHLKVVALNTKNYVLKHFTVYIGSINSSAVRVGEIFKEALKQNAAAIIIAHNHPSGAPRSA